MNTYTVINIHTHEIAATGKASSAAGRVAMNLGAAPAGWYKVRGGIAEAKAAAAYLTADLSDRVAMHKCR